MRAGASRAESAGTARGASTATRPETPWPARPLLVLLTILALALGLRLVFAAGISGNDDLATAGNAINLLERGFEVPHSHYAARFGLTVPLAGVFAVLGVGIRQLEVLPMAASLLGIALAYRIGALLFTPAVGLCAAAALALYPMDVEFAGVLFPDNVQGAAMAATVALALMSDPARRRPGAPGGALCAVLAGACWAYAYYVKIDAFFLAPVLLIATALGYLPFRYLVLTGLTALALVGVEFVLYGRATGNPLYNAALTRIANDELLAPGMDYRNLLTYPKAMFLTVYETGLAFYLLLAAMAVAVARRSRPALLLVGWVLVFYAWLNFGFDPLSGTFRAKPQLPRYLLVFAIPMSVLIGWLLVLAWSRLSRPLTLAVGAAAAGVALLFMPFNMLEYEPARATRIAVEQAIENHWFPLYTDWQSLGIVNLLLHGRPEAAAAQPAQRHNFITGQTTFEPIPPPRAYLLVNEDYARRNAARSLVKPIDPAQFGLRPTEILSVDNPMPRLSYLVLRLVAGIADLLPAAGLRAHIHATAAEVLRPGDAHVYRLDGPP